MHFSKAQTPGKYTWNRGYMTDKICWLDFNDVKERMKMKSEKPEKDF